MDTEPKEIALRIGLAARELPDTDVARLLGVLNDLVSLPPNHKELKALTVKDLKNAKDGEFSHIDTENLKTALSLLKGEIGTSLQPLPDIQTYNQGDMPNSIRIACASNKGEILDGHFGSCQRFLVYQVSQSEQRLIDIRNIDNSQASDDKNAYRASLIKDCQILFVASIGGPAAAKVVRQDIHPIKKPQTGPSSEVIKELQQVIGKDAPPWLAKIMGQSPEDRIRFEQDSVLEADA